MIETGSLVLDYFYPNLIPENGIIEISGYPGSGLTTIINRIIEHNHTKHSILLCTPFNDNIPNIPDLNVCRSYCIEDLGNAILEFFRLGNTNSLIIIDSIVDYTSYAEIDTLIKRGFKSIDSNAVMYNLFNLLRIISLILIETKSTLIIGSLRKFKVLPDSIMKYISEYTKVSSEILDHFTTKTLFLRYTHKIDDIAFIETQLNSEKTPGLPIPIDNKAIRHDIEKFEIEEHLGKIKNRDDYVIKSKKKIPTNDYILSLTNTYETIW